MAPGDTDRPDLISNRTSLSFRARHRNSVVLSCNDQAPPPQTHSQRLNFHDYSDERRLNLLRVIARYQIQTLLVEPGFDPDDSWVLRKRLGAGGSFAVHEETLPVASLFSGRLRYRNFKVRGSDQGPMFQDHTQAQWNFGSSVAFKTSNVDPDSIITELRVLCHEPLQNHPNIVHLIGIAWITDQSAQDTSNGSEVLEWPAIVLEKAPYGSLQDFLISSGP